MSENSRRELGDFLRSRRERLSPERAGLPTSGRRRTPGLRREEVAVLAGVGVTWYTWLEQGRPINASSQVLHAIGRSLRLTEAEHRHLWTLAGERAPIPAVDRVPEVTDAFQPVLTKLDPYPACIQNARFDVLGYNRSYRFLFRDLDAMEPQERNCLRLFFTDADWRGCYRDTDIVAVRLAAKLRATMGAHLDEPSYLSLVEELRERSPLFRELWSRHDVMVQQYDVKRIEQPQVGLLQLNFVWASVDDGQGLRMSVMTPSDEITAQRLQRLAEENAPIADTEYPRAS